MSPSGTRWSPQETTLTLAVFTLLWCTAVSQWWIADLVIPWDAKNHFYPMLRYLAAQIHAGEWPLWNPYHFAGHPTIADPQSLIFTPTLSFVALLWAEPSMRAFDLAVLGHLLVGGLALIGLLRRRGWHPAGALLAALVYAMGGSASARLQHVGMIVSYGLFPVAWLMLETALARRSWLRAIGFGVVAALLALDRDQIAYMCCLTLVAVLLAEAVNSGAPFTYLRERFVMIALMGITGVLILAVPVTLTLQFLADSNRPEFDYTYAANSSLHITSLATLLFPNVYGNLNWTYDYWGPGPHTIVNGPWSDPASTYLGIGTIPALLLLWHGIAGQRIFAREFRFFLALIVLALLFALGRYTPFFEVLFHHMPGVNLYRRPADATFIINLGLAFSTGYLVHRHLRDGAPTWQEMAGSWPRRAVSLLCIAAVIGSIASALYFGSMAKQVGFAVTQISVGLAIAIATVALLVSFASERRLRFISALVVVAIASGELIARNAGSALSGEPASRYAVFAVLPPEQQKGLQILRAEIAERQARGERPRVEILGLGGAWQNASMIFNLEDTVGYNALRIAEYEEAVGSGENAVDLKLRTFPGTFTSYKSSLASLLGLQYLVLDRPIEMLPSHFPKAPATMIYESKTLFIYRLDNPAPRTYLATKVRAVDNEEALEKGDMPVFDRENEVLISEDDVDRLKGQYGQGGEMANTPNELNERVRIVSYKANKVTIEIETASAGVLVLHDPYYPGWKVRVDGQEKDLLHANLLFRGVEVQKGKSLVEFSFEPLSMENLVAAATSVLSPEVEKP